MPTYQYACTECGHDFEAVQSFSDDALADCPVCEGRLRKVFSSVGIVFKGSGFYRNDSREAASSASAKADTNGTDTSDKGDKPADKKEKVGATADSGTRSSDSPVKTPAASPSSTPASAATKKSSSTAGSAA